MDFGQGDGDMALCCELALIDFVDATVPLNNGTSTHMSWHMMCVP